MISPTLTSSGTASTSSAAATSVQAEAVLSSDFETFINMLTTQAKYQDPLEPLDSSEYAAQLAQFSMVEQQVLSNDLLTALSSQLGGSNVGQMASWIGMEARTTAPIQFDGTPLTILPEQPVGAETAQLVVYDSSGQEVDRGAIPISSDPVVWAGVASDGQPLTSGLYSFEVEATDSAGNTLATTQAATYAKIVEVQNLGADAQVIFEGGAQASANGVTALRQGS